MTYRFRGHSAQDTQKYRTKEDVEKHRSGDPIERYRQNLIEQGVFAEKDAERIDEEVDDQVEAAVQFAEESEEPGLEWIKQSGVYAAPIDVNPPIHGE
jgi:pyruvate dehydrogenase E1 component alpha subunit